jgi:hypothetical protein
MNYKSSKRTLLNRRPSNLFHCRDSAKDEGRKREHLRYWRKPNVEDWDHWHLRRVRPPLHDVNRRPFDTHADHQSEANITK